ncbi:MAG: ribonuclease D [Rhodospirillales bacterium]|nr:ribonuclease D [Alphaproteobacteria bacterium]USO03968.1 MAG: ribonuclease D [Rhodospirillales bacterium]
MTVTLHKNDLPADLSFKESVAIDTEAMGLKTERDRLCLVQLSSGDGTAHLIQFDKGCYDAPNLKKLLLDENVTKLFHFARFDVAILKAYLGVECTPIYCTKIASRLCRTYTDRHGLKDLTRHLLDVNLDKQQQTSDWGAEILTEEQITYAASDVLYLHALREKLDEILEREGRTLLFERVCEALKVRAALDLEGWGDTDIFAH